MPVWGCICIYVPLYTSSFWMPTSYSIEQMQPTSLSGDQHLCFPNSCYCEQCTNEYCSCMFILLSIFLNINLRNGIWGSKYISVQFSSVQSLSHVQLFATPWTAAHQASPSITNCRSPPKPMSIESMMPSNHLILCHPLLLLPSIFPSIRIFSNYSALHIRWPKYWSFSLNISPSNEHQGLISFRMDCLELLAVQGTWALGKCLLEIKYGFLFLVSYRAWWLSS